MLDLMVIFICPVLDGLIPFLGKFVPKNQDFLLKGCVHYIFVSLFCKSKEEHLWNKEKCFLFHFESYLRSWDNQILTFQIFKCDNVIKCSSMKHETHLLTNMGNKHSLVTKFGQFM